MRLQCLFCRKYPRLRATILIFSLNVAGESSEADETEERMVCVWYIVKAIFLCLTQPLI